MQIVQPTNVFPAFTAASANLAQSPGSAQTTGMGIPQNALVAPQPQGMFCDPTGQIIQMLQATLATVMQLVQGLFGLLGLGGSAQQPPAGPMPQPIPYGPQNGSEPCRTQSPVESIFGKIGNWVGSLFGSGNATTPSNAPTSAASSGILGTLSNWGSKAIEGISSGIGSIFGSIGSLFG